MDPRLLHYYNRELQHVRETCGEFAKDYPKIAGRLGLEGFECADPYVERLIEGFAYMAARVQLKVDAEFPGFTQRLLDMVYPDYLAPIPSMGIVQFAPDMSQGTLNEGVVLPRGTVLRSLLGKGAQTPCEYRTAHDVTLWPIALVRADTWARLRRSARAASPSYVKSRPPFNCACRRRPGPPLISWRSTLLLSTCAAAIRSGRDYTSSWSPTSLLSSYSRRGVTANGARSSANLASGLSASTTSRRCCRVVLDRSTGIALLREYFAFAERFMFVELNLGAALRRCGDTEVEVVVLFDRAAPLLVDAVDASRFALFCTPAINLFPKRTDRIHISGRQNEFHVVPDRSRPLDFEVYGITSVVGYGTGNAPECAFSPFYACSDATDFRQHGAYYTVQREQRVVSSRQRRVGPRTSYIGSETFVALVDADETPFRSELRQLAIEALCTNRDLPLDMPVGVGKTDLTLDIHAPVQSVRFVAGPTEPRPTIAQSGDGVAADQPSVAQLLVAGRHRRAAGRRRACARCSASTRSTEDPAVHKQIEGVRSSIATPIHRRLPIPGPVTFGRGLEVAADVRRSRIRGNRGISAGRRA